MLKELKVNLREYVLSTGKLLWKLENSERLHRNCEADTRDAQRFCPISKRLSNWLGDG